MKPTVGRIVNFTLPDYPVGARNAGEVRGAVITRVWNNTCVNLRVFTDGSNDEGQSEYHTSVVQGDVMGKWNWPVRS
jgi:hypothetical protein